MRRLVDKLSYINVVAATAIFASFSGASAIAAVEATNGGVPVNNGGGPTIICGQTIDRGPVGPTVQDIKRPGHYKAGAMQVGRGLPDVFDFAKSCSAGVGVVLKPHGVLKLAAAAHTEDHRVAAIAVEGRRAGVGRIIATFANGKRAIITLHVRPAAPPGSGNKVKT